VRLGGRLVWLAVAAEHGGRGWVTTAHAVRSRWTAGEPLDAAHEQARRGGRDVPERHVLH
jgi:hypothetical protein